MPELALDGDAAPADAAASGRAPVAPGDTVVVQTSEGPAVGTVTRAIAVAGRAQAPGRRIGSRAAQGDARRRRRAAQASAARAGRAPDLPDEDPRARPGDEAGARRAAVRRVAADLLLHGRGAGRLPRAGARPRRALPHAHRDAADRRARRGAHARRLRILRPSAVLHDVAAVVRADLDQDGEAAEPEPEPVEAVGDVRPAEVLPALRAAERQGREARRLRRRRRLRQLQQPDRPAADAGRAAAAAAGPVVDDGCRRIGITVGDPAGIGPEIARQGGSAIPACSASASRCSTAPTDDPTDRDRPRLGATPAARPTTPSCSAVDDARRERIAAIATAPINKEAFAAAGIPVARPHGAARAPHRRDADRDDVPRRRAARRARDRAHSARRRAARAHARSRSRRRSIWPRRSCRASVSPSPRLARGRAQSACRRARPDGARGGCGAAAGDRGVPRPRRSRSTGRFRPTRSSCARCAASSTR